MTGYHDVNFWNQDIENQLGDMWCHVIPNTISCVQFLKKWIPIVDKVRWACTVLKFQQMRGNRWLQGRHRFALVTTLATTGAKRSATSSTVQGRCWLQQRCRGRWGAKPPPPPPSYGTIDGTAGIELRQPGRRTHVGLARSAKQFCPAMSWRRRKLRLQTGPFNWACKWLIRWFILSSHKRPFAQWAKGSLKKGSEMGHIRVHGQALISCDHTQDRLQRRVCDWSSRRVCDWSRWGFDLRARTACT